MTPPRSAPVLFVPSASTHAAYAPGREQRLPAVDERLVAPESRAEIVDGVVYRTMGSNQPHGTRHFAAAHVFAGALTEAQRARVAACDDEGVLVAWFERAVVGEGAAAILGA